MTWRALIGNFLQWERPPNPYNHLRVYLTEQQLEEITGLPHGSRQQIDRIIAIVDSVGACDESLREMIYRWFDKVQ